MPPSPIKLRRLYAREDRTGDFVLVAEPLTASVYSRMTDAQLLERRKAERAAIDAEWKRLGSRT
jgi:hypothetical protein